MFFKSVFTVFSFFIITLCHAVPWVEPDDLALRNDIQLLADAGIITAPVTTYPLMWNAIKSDILSAKVHLLTDTQKQALNHVKFSYYYASQNQNITKKSVYLASHANRFTSYGNREFDRGYIALSDDFFVRNLAGKLQVNYRMGINETSELNQASDMNIDGSFLAYKLGNWVVSAGAIDRWWGPSIDSNLIMSTNARSLPAISLTRDNSNAFETPWLSWIGPWTLTAQMAKLEENRAVSNTLMWSTRGTFRPIRGLEIGASWSFQWAGEGQPGSIKDFFDILKGGQKCANGDSTCDAELNTYEGNHLAGYDIRWSDVVFGLPYAVYFQTIGEDGSPNEGLITDKANMYGIETRFSLFEHRVLVNIEYSDTQVACGDVNTSFNCFYEHGTYQSGYRYYQRSIGSTYDNDAQSLVTTFLIQTASGNSWQAKLRKVELNTDNTDGFSNNINLGNQVSKVAEDLLEFDGQYKFIAFDSRFTLGLTLTHSTFDKLNTSDTNNVYKDDTEIDAYIKWEYRFK